MSVSSCQIAGLDGELFAAISQHFGTLEDLEVVRHTGYFNICRFFQTVAAYRHLKLFTLLTYRVTFDKGLLDKLLERNGDGVGGSYHCWCWECPRTFELRIKMYVKGSELKSDGGLLGKNSDAASWMGWYRQRYRNIGDDSPWRQYERGQAPEDAGAGSWVCRIMRQ